MSSLPHDSGSIDPKVQLPSSIPQARPPLAIEPAGYYSNSPAPTPQPQLLARKRRHSTSTSGPSGIFKPYIFTLPDNWADVSPVGIGLREHGFYTSTDVPQFADGRCPDVVVNELRVYRSYPEPSNDLRLHNCIHSLLQQVLVQNPHVYLTALAAMKTTNHRLISLPTTPKIFSSSDNSKLMDPTFPFAKCIASDKNVPATRILYSLDNANLRIGTSLSTKPEVKGWWDRSGGNLEVAATQLPLKEFPTTRLQAGEFLAMPPHLLWYVESNFPTGNSGSATVPATKFVEVRYISVAPNEELDFDCWPRGAYDQISRFNRDLLVPAGEGWATEPVIGEERFKGAIEMRGVWAIGDALLGLMSWHSPLVQLELRQLFDPLPGDWFNRTFVEDVQTRFDKKLASMVETLKSVHQHAFT